MEKLSMCRICRSDDISLRSIVNTNLEEMYESLTKTPFVAEDIRPILACKLCCVSLKNCYELRRSCLESEELFVQLLRRKAQVNLQIMPDVNLSTEDVIQMTPNVFDNVKVKQDNAEAAQDDSGTSSDSQDNVATEYILKSDPDVNNIEPNVAVEQDDADLYHSALGLHTECDIPLDIVKEEPDDVDTGTPRLTAQTYRKDTLLNSLKKIDQTMFKVEEPRRETKKDIAVKPIKKNEIVETRDNTHIKVCNNKQTSDQNNAHKKKFENKFHADQSINSSSSNELKKFVCDTCQKCFKQRCHLNIHIRIHTGEKPYVCNVCKKSFTDKSNLEKHTRIHTGEKPYECALCKKSFTDNSTLRSHIRTHTDDKPYVCNVCNKCFAHKSTLEMHTRTHTGEKPYVCDVCKKCFIQKCALERHTRTHTGEKPYVCAVCKKCFIQKCTLEKHTRTHTGEKPYVCDVCKKCFTDKTNLKRHTRIHTVQKPYECSVCKKCFRDKSYFIRHIRIHTVETP